MARLPVKFLPGWLFGISASRVEEDLREKLIRCQRESCYVLWEAFQEGRLTTEVSFGELLDSDTMATQACKIVASIMKMAH